MKKHLTAILAVLFFAFFAAKSYSEKSNLVTQLLVYDADSTFKYIYYYDNNSNKVLEAKYFLKDNVWGRTNQVEWIYNDNKCITQRERKFINGDWENNYEINYTYEDGKLISEKHTRFVNDMEVDLKLITFSYENDLITSRKEFDYVNNSLIISQIIQFVYDNDILVETDFKNVTGNKEYKILSEYDAESLLKTQTLLIKNTEGEWENNQKTIWYYTESKEISSQRVKTWNTQINGWEYASMLDYEYDGTGKILSEIYSDWKSMFWEENLKYVYEYDIEGLLSRKLLQMTLYRKWRTFSSIDYSNYENNKANLMETKLSFWGDNGTLVSTDIPFIFNSETEIRRGNQIVISYEKIDNTEIATYSLSNGMTINVYPNPSEGMFYYNPDKYNVSNWTVIDINGKIVQKSNAVEKSGIIDLTDLPVGIYMLRVVTPDNVLSQKLIRK